MASRFGLSRFNIWPVTGSLDDVGHRLKLHFTGRRGRAVSLPLEVVVGVRGMWDVPAGRREADAREGRGLVGGGARAAVRHVVRLPAVPAPHVDLSPLPETSSTLSQLIAFSLIQFYSSFLFSYKDIYSSNASSRLTDVL